MASTINCNTEKIAEADRPGTERCEQAGNVAAHISLQADPFDYADWLREYRRWTQSGSCAGARRGEIEWGGEGSN